MNECLVDIVAQHAKSDPTRTAIVVSGQGQLEQSTALTYTDLDRAARSVAACLQRRCSPGDRVLLMYPAGMDFVIAFIGCLYAGVLPVPAPVPEGRKHHLMPATGIALDAEVTMALTDGQTLPAVFDWMSQDGLDDVGCVATDLAVLEDPDSWTRPEIDQDSIAYLRYNPAPSSDPKGVVVTHRNLLRSMDLVCRTLRLTSDDRFATCLPPYDEMGLVGLLLTPLYLGSTVVQLPTAEHHDQPLRWLDLIGRYDVQVSGGPSSLYELCTREATDERVARLNLACWRHAWMDTEPIDVDVWADFSARFAAAGFRAESLRPSYFLPEATCMVAGAAPSVAPVVHRAAPRALEQGTFLPAVTDADAPPLISCPGVDEIDVRIVEPISGIELGADRVGEIWVRGPSVALGYWRRAELTRRTFQATTADGEQGFLRTGNLGVLHNGELLIMGGKDDLLTLGGRNLYSRDLEREMFRISERFQGLPSCVFTVPVRESQLVVVQEVQAGQFGLGELGQLARTVRARLSELCRVPVGNVVFVRPGRIRRTVGGPVQRRLMRELFIAHALDPIYEELEPEARRRYRPMWAAPASVRANMASVS